MESALSNKLLLLKALVLAGPFLLFPAARSYYLFYVAILVWGIMEAGLPALWREGRALRLAVYALGLPVVLTFLVWVLRGELHVEWLEKAGLMLLGGLLGMSASRLSNDGRIQSLVTLLLSVAVMAWLLDGLLQLLTGHSIDCRGGNSPCVLDDRLSIFWATNSKLSYYLGMFSLIPASWLISQGRRNWGLLVLAAGGIVTMAAASRFSMLSWVAGCGVLALVATLRLPRRLRFGVVVLLPLVFLAVGTLLYNINPAFQGRMDSTAQVFQGNDYEAVNRALSGRLDIWGPTVQMLRGQWLVGVGPEGLDGAIRPFFAPDNAFVNMKIYHAHQVVLDILAATGVVGLAAFLLFYGWVGREFLRASREGIDVRWACLLVFLLSWFPLNSPNGFYASEMVLLTFFVLGLGFGFRRNDLPARPI